MSMNRFLNGLSTMLVGRSEKRFARELARTLGFRVHEPEHGTKPKASPPPAPDAPTKPAPPKAEPMIDSYQRGQAAGKNWGFNRAFRTDRERLAKWAATAGGKFSVREVAAVIFPKPDQIWVKLDADD